MRAADIIDRVNIKLDYERAREWRIAHNLSVIELAALIGYSRESVWAFERGEKPGTDDPPSAWVWLRYRMACAGLEAQLVSGKNFNWEMEQ